MREHSIHLGLLLVSLASTIGMFGCEPMADTSWSNTEKAPVFRAAQFTEVTETPSEVRVMAWNIKYGAGRIPFWFDCWGDRVQLTPEEVQRNMKAIAMIREANPDILMVERLS